MFARSIICEIVKQVYVIDSDCCAIYCSASELSERVNSTPKAILTARGTGSQG